MRPALALALVTHAVLATGYLFTTPVFEGPDEYGHYESVRYLLEKEGLPTIQGTSEQTGLPRWREATMAHHGPVYYAWLAGWQVLLGASDVTPFQQTPPERAGPTESHAVRWQHGFDEVAPISHEVRVFQAARAWSVVFGLVSLLLVHRLGRRVFPERPAVADLATLLLACLPQWSFTHGVLDNGNLATCLCLAALVLLIPAPSPSPQTTPAPATTVRNAALFGLVAGTALLVKFTSIFLAPLAAAAFALELARAKDRRRETLLAITVCAATGLAVVGWFLLRNHRLYGDFLALNVHGDAFATTRIPNDEVRFRYLTHGFWRLIWRSLVGTFGWGNLAVPQSFLWGAGALVAAALAGWLAHGRRLLERPRAVLLLALAAALVWAGVLRYNWNHVQPQGRYLFPGIGPMVLLVAAGLIGLFEATPLALRRAAAALTLALPLVGLWTWRSHVAPVLRPDPLPSQRFHANLVEDVTTAPPTERATIALVSPTDGAELDAPPILRWTPPPTAPEGAHYTVHVYAPDGRLHAATFEMARVEITGDAWAYPPDFWELLPRGETILWKVRRLPNRLAGEGVANVEESAPRSFSRPRSAAD